MYGNDRADSLDARIDDALRTYAVPEPIPEARVVTARLLVREREVEARRKRTLWAWAVPAAACLVALAIGAEGLLRPVRSPETARALAAPRVTASAPVVQAAPVSMRVAQRRPARMVPAHRVLAEEQPLPKLEVFPTPTPLSPQERALEQFARTASPQVKRALFEDQEHPQGPAALAELKIRPLDEGVNQYPLNAEELP